MYTHTKETVTKAELRNPAYLFPINLSNPLGSIDSGSCNKEMNKKTAALLTRLNLARHLHPFHGS